MPGQGLFQTQDQRMQMVLAPQLRQSLEFLQVPLLELRTLVQQELEKNPTLEEKVNDDPRLEIEPGSNESGQDSELNFKEEFEVLARLDDEWREYFNQNHTTRTYTEEDAAKRQFFLDSLSQPPSLHEHLFQQLAYSGLNDEERRIAELLVGSINDDGYLTTSLEELAQSTGHTLDEIRPLIEAIQEMDPIGVGAQDLRECLLLQLQRLGMSDSLAATIVRDHLADLGAKHYAQIARALKVPLEEVQRAARFIGTLEPRPGRLFSSEAPAYVLPEVQVQKVGDGYVVIMNRDEVPHLRISKHYRQLMENTGTSDEVKAYIRDKVRSGAFLIKSIHQRLQTIQRIAQEIVRIQRDFFDHGITHLKPLTMAEIARILGVHETTVSRAIANKYIQTPRGVFEMKYFFTPGYRNSNGQDVSNKTIKDTIQQMVADENPAHPLSDQEIVEALTDQGIKVARRTIAKYRDALNILPSHLRKQ